MGNHPRSITPYILFIKDMENITQNRKTQKQCVLCVWGGLVSCFLLFRFLGRFFCFVLFCLREGQLYCFARQRGT